MKTVTIVDDLGTTIEVGARTVTGGTIVALEDWDERGWRVVETWPDGDREEWITRSANPGPNDSYDLFICDEVRTVIPRTLPSADAAMVARLAHEQGLD